MFYYCCPTTQNNNNSVLTAINDYALINVATPVQINLMANDIIPTQAIITINQPANPNTEGDVIVNDAQTGNITFTPAPRFLSTAIFGYQLSNSNSISSATVKINVDLSYSVVPAFLYVNGSENIRLISVNDPDNNRLVITTNNVAVDMAGNRGDAILYYYDSFSGPNGDVYAHDYITGAEFSLLNVVDIGFGNLNIDGMGFDNNRYFLYMGFESGNQIAQIMVKPYDRYGNPGVQQYSSTSLTLPLSGTVREIAVQDETGYLYIVITDADDNTLIKYNPFDGSLLAQTPLTIARSHVVFANDGILYLVQDIDTSFAEVHIVNPTDLTYSPPIATIPYVTDLAVPLYNM